ncbi:YhcN/YlaJ family sporulation lipoprotein [Halalkalibacter urbisdiaboli]|uniref:YhcN/YlaJ family sporulation lipoprotein n=1 Tax=Halalkalibacter urbisdiaboli TaxID=1960589 RepID=UPI000B433DBE|nr:YhcN/YlaJ family sporulation lipoprotein [Halalkalibacter urbisdiaboli]
MKHILWMVVFVCCLSGCVIEQKQQMGANSDRTQGFSGYGTENARDWEGPLMDLMVPDRAPKGLTDKSQEILNDPNYLINNRNLGMNHQGINSQGARIQAHRPGTIRDKQIRSDEPYLRSKGNAKAQHQASLTETIEQRVKSLESVHDVHVISDGQVVVLGIESSESDRKKLYRSVKNEVRNLVDINRVRITTNRQLINRMKRLEHQMAPIPFGGTIAEIIDGLESNNR